MGVCDNCVVQRKGSKGGYSFGYRLTKRTSVPTMKLIATKVKNFTLPANKGIAYLSDGHGLRLKFRRRAKNLEIAQVWQYRYRSAGGKEQTFTIGEYPLQSLKEVREKTFEARKLVESGNCPNAVAKAGLENTAANNYTLA